MKFQTLNAPIKILLFSKISLIISICTVLIMLFQSEFLSLVFAFLILMQFLILKRYFNILDVTQQNFNAKHQYYSKRLNNYIDVDKPEDGMHLISCRHDMERSHRLDKSLKQLTNNFFGIICLFSFLVSVFNAYLIASVLSVEYYNVNIAHIPLYTVLISLAYILAVFYISTKIDGYTRLMAQ